MTWKSTAAASGLMVVATWLASHAPVGGPRETATFAPSPARTESAAAEIQREAERLHDRLQQVTAYRAPARNLFRFSARHAPPAARQRELLAHDVPAPVVAPQPVAPSLSLAGIGEDGEGEQLVRTAIISTPNNVHIVKVGDTIEGGYKVTGIAADTVDLERLDDGTAIRLTLRR
jgi:hypothetical protein